jgi:hypothetical protein
MAQSGVRVLFSDAGIDDSTLDVSAIQAGRYAIISAWPGPVRFSVQPNGIDVAVRLHVTHLTTGRPRVEEAVMRRLRDQVAVGSVGFRQMPGQSALDLRQPGQCSRVLAAGLTGQVPDLGTATSAGLPVEV